jgi:hypothetical protein
MEHRGVEYQVVRSISPNAWRWSVGRDSGGEKVELSDSLEHAIFRACKYIDKMLERREQPEK